MKPDIVPSALPTLDPSPERAPLPSGHTLDGDAPPLPRRLTLFETLDPRQIALADIFTEEPSASATSLAETQARSVTLTLQQALQHSASWLSQYETNDAIVTSAEAEHMLALVNELAVRLRHHLQMIRP